jgi:hypothetical protein
MSICIGSNCYEKVEKNNVVYFIKSVVFKHNELSTETKPLKLTLMSDFVFDVVTKSGGAVHELIKRR